VHLQHKHNNNNNNNNNNNPRAVWESGNELCVQNGEDFEMQSRLYIQQQPLLLNKMKYKDTGKRSELSWLNTRDGPGDEEAAAIRPQQN
jgi:hypothetical protein